MDGVTVGHPRCKVDLCTNRLRSPRDRFCVEHTSRNDVCAIHECDLPATPGRRTCSTPAHQQYEDQRREDGQAIFRLKNRLHNRAMTSIIHGLSGDHLEESVEANPRPTDDTDLFDEVVLPSNALGQHTSRIPLDPISNGSGTTATKMKNALGRRYTHNEQLMVRCCGVILAQATFFEAESMSNCHVGVPAFYIGQVFVDDCLLILISPRSVLSSPRSLSTSLERFHLSFSSTIIARFSSTYSALGRIVSSRSASRSMFSMPFANTKTPMDSVS